MKNSIPVYVWRFLWPAQIKFYTCSYSLEYFSKYIGTSGIHFESSAALGVGANTEINFDLNQVTYTKYKANNSMFILTVKLIAVWHELYYNWISPVRQSSGVNYYLKFTSRIVTRF